MTCNCGNEIPLKRIELGFKECLNCSKSVKKSAIPVINHKTGNEIQIVDDPKVAEEFFHLSKRKGFGTLNGLQSGFKQKTITKKKIQKIETVKEFSVKISQTLDKSNYKDEFHSLEFFTILDNSKEEALQYLNKFFQLKEISVETRKRLIYILNQNNELES